MNKIYLLSFYLLISINIFAQFDTNYVFLTKDKFALYPMGESSVSTFFFDETTPDGSISSVDYHSRRFSSVGFGASFYRIGLSFSFELPITDIPELKKHKAFNFKGGYSYHKFYAELRLQTYSGVKEEITDPGIDTSISKIRTDINIVQYGGNVYYFTSHKFNYDANFKNYNLQKKSAISPFINMGVNYYRIKGDFLLTDTMPDNSESYVTQLSNISVRLIPSLAGTVVYKGFYFAAMAGLGLGFNKNYLGYNKLEEDFYGFMPVVEINTTAGYANKSFFVSLVYSIESVRVKYGKSYLGTVNSLWNLKIGKKINIKYLGKVGKYL